MTISSEIEVNNYFIINKIGNLTKYNFISHQNLAHFQSSDDLRGNGQWKFLH